MSALVSSLRTASGLWCDVVDTLHKPVLKFLFRSDQLSVFKKDIETAKQKLSNSMIIYMNVFLKDLFQTQSLARPQLHEIFW